MTDLLCNWLNTEVKLSAKIAPTNFAREFASGFLLGELLHKFGLQNDFDQFSQNRTSEAKLNNFTRLEPILHLLNVSFDTNIARDVMTEKQEAATRLLYELFVALTKKQKNNLTGVAMETMRPAAPAKLEGITSSMYRERLKHLTPRQTDLNLDMMMTRFHQKQHELEQTAFKERFEEEERRQRQLQDQRLQLIQQLKDNRDQKSETLAKILAANVTIPKPPPNKTAKAIALKRNQKKQLAIEEMTREMTMFDTRLKRSMTSAGMEDSQSINSGEDESSSPHRISTGKESADVDYMKKLKQTAAENKAARLEREKRRRKVLYEQLKAQDAQEEEKREAMLVSFLMRQSLQERRIATQLLHVRHEKQVICDNRLMREKQFEERRLQEFQLALDKEAEMARLAKIEYEEQMRHDQDLHDRMMAERAQKKYAKHYDFCYDAVSDIVDLVTKIGEYRELTNQLIPAKLMRDWMDLFVAGQPQYFVQEPDTEQGEADEEKYQVQLDELRHQLLNETDFEEYKEMCGAWSPPESSQVTDPPKDNPVLGHVVHRLLDMVHPDQLAPGVPEFPSFPIKACILGKSFSGKTTCAETLKQSHNLEVLSIDRLLKEAIGAFQEREVIEEEYIVARTEENVFETGSGRNVHSTSMDDELLIHTGSAAAAVSVASGSRQQLTPDQVTSPPPLPVPQGRTLSPSPSAQGRATESVELDLNVASATDQQSHEEKTDPEKPYCEEIMTREVPSGRARLGEKALKCLSQGKAVDDEILVDIIVEAIRNLSSESGWVLDGFPVRFSQLMLLERALTGFDMTDAESPDDFEKLNARKKPRKSQLVSNPHPDAPPPDPKSGINLVVELDLPDDTCLKRCAGRFYAAQSDHLSEKEFKPSPAGSMTGLGSQEVVVPVHNVAHDQEQIHHRLAAFADEWPKLTKWFSKYGHLVTVDAEQSEDVLISQVSGAFDDILQQLEVGPDDMVMELIVAEEKPLEEIPPPEPVQSLVEVAPASPAEGHKSRSSSGDRPKSGSESSRDKKDRSSSRETSPKSPPPKSPQKSPKPAKSPRKGGKGKKEPEPEPEPVEPTGPPPPQPGSSEWVYVSQPIDMDLVKVLVSYWETTETSYVMSSKDVFQLIRDEREQIIRYLFQIREDFKDYLKRPDFKQEFITQWQKNYNEVPDELRDDEDMRADLHQRVDDLRERLWNISDERKENAEKERARVMANGWVDDHTGILSNHYISLMQVELDRFQDAVHLLQDYYRGMEGRVPDETSSDFARIPLLEVLPTECPPTPSKGDQGDPRAQSAVLSPSGTEPEGGKKSVTPVGKKKKTETQEMMEDKKKIPLIPRRPASPDMTARTKAERARGKGGKDLEDLPPLPQDPDDRLIYDVFVSALSAIDKILGTEAALREAEEEAERQRQAAKEAERKKQEAAERKRAGKAGKAGGGDEKKNRSPSPKKGKGKETLAAEIPLTAASEETEEEKQKKIDKEKGKQEYFAAIMEEASAAKCRINLIRCVSSLILQELKTRVDATYNVLNDWIGDEFLKEMASIDELTEVLRNAIETSSKLYEELTLQQKDFAINRDVWCAGGEDTKLGRSPSPLPPPEFVEDSIPDGFTVQQIKALYNQFSMAAPNGVLPIKSFQEMIQTMAALAHHAELLPESWLTLTHDKLEQISQQLSADRECIDWHSFLLQVSQPWPMPSQSQLLDTLRLFHEMDQRSQGTVTREQFNEVNLWLKESSETPAPSDTADRFDRMAHLTAAFFDIFADHSKDPPLLNYVDMLLYFGMAPDPFEGFLRALSIVTERHMPRLAKKKLLSKKQQTSDGVEELDKQQGEDEGKVVWPEDIPASAVDARVTLDNILKVLLHGKSQHGEFNRFVLTSASDSEDEISKDRLANIFMELGAENGHQPLPVTVLLEHPVIQDLVYGCTAYKAIDLKGMLMVQGENAVPELTDSPVG